MSLSNAVFEELMGLPKEAIICFSKDYTVYRIIAHTSGFGYRFCPLDEIMMTVVHLRHYPVDLFLAAIFETVKSTSNKIRKRLLDWLYSVLHGRLSFKSYTYRLQRAFTYFYSLLTFGIDGSEQGIKAASKNPQINLQFFSGKKGYHTINIVVVVDLYSKVLWVSKAFPGNTNDDTITKKILKELFDNLEDNEKGVGDLGFEGCSKRILTPPPRYSKLYPDFAHLRVVVENALADIKDWRCCKDDIRDSIKKEMEVLDRHHKRWVVCSVFKNDYNTRGNVVK